jgi:hypothetical protein
LNALEAVRYKDGEPVYRLVDSKQKGGPRRLTKQEPAKLYPLFLGDMAGETPRWWRIGDPIEHVKNGGSFVCDAPPGFGKSELLKRVREAIGECTVIAPTHTAVRRHPGAMTVHSFVHKHILNGTFKGTLLIDEYSHAVPGPVRCA